MVSIRDSKNQKLNNINNRASHRNIQLKLLPIPNNFDRLTSQAHSYDQKIIKWEKNVYITSYIGLTEGSIDNKQEGKNPISRKSVPDY